MLDLKELERKLDEALSDTEKVKKYFCDARKRQLLKFLRKKLPFEYETTSFVGKPLKG